ncbi:MAG: helix-hairpin-helix domain-containing protein [Terracidiphilus sp.]
MTLFLQETGFPVSIFSIHLGLKVYDVAQGMAQNREVRIRVIFGVLAVAMICALSTGPLSFAFQLPRIAPATPAPEARIDINTASIEQLTKVPGMTRTWAARIIRYRPYRAKNDLIDRGVVTSQVYDAIKDYIIAHRVKP